LVSAGLSALKLLPEFPDAVAGHQPAAASNYFCHIQQA
jgi:hypothetical protein